MLSFFRKIRRELIDSGKLKQYLVYALGEVVLIVVGIILALQINNWNVNRVSQEDEKVLFGNIVEDLSSDYESLQLLIRQAMVKQDIHKRLYRESIAELQPRDDGPYSAEMVETTNPISKTWNNHRSSIERITDRAIRRELNEYFRQYQILLDYSTTLNQVILDDFRPYLKRKELINYKTVFESSPDRDDFDRFNFFHNEKLRAQFGSPELNALILELYLGTQDVIQWLETLAGLNQSLQLRLDAAAD